MKIIRNDMNLQDKARWENAEAQVATNKANIDYIAMMTDVEIPTGEEEAEDESEV